MLIAVTFRLLPALFAALIAMIFWLPPASQAQSYRVAVSAGPYERAGTVVSFALPEEASGDAYRLEDAEGQAIPLQLDGARRAWFVLDRLAAHAERAYRLVPLDVRQEAEPSPLDVRRGADSLASDVQAGTDVQVERSGGDLAALVAGDTLFVYHVEVDAPPRPDIDTLYARGGYIHPLYSPSGRLITDHYPPNHLHQQGIFSAWTKTSFEGREPDFWNMGKGTGAVRPAGLDTTWSGPVHGGFEARHAFVDLSAPEPKTVLDEAWRVRAYGVTGEATPYRLFDLDATQEAASERPLELPTYHYGGVAVRGHRDWDGEANATFLTSEGLDRPEGNETEARWVYLGGRVEGEQTGVAVLSHPENFRAPQPVRLHPDEPYFVFAPQQAGPFAIEPGEPYTARYRYVALDGPPDAALLDRLWNDYAYPPEVTVREEG